MRRLWEGVPWTASLGLVLSVVSHARIIPPSFCSNARRIQSTTTRHDVVASTRRDSFGEILGTVLLPVVVGAEPAHGTTPDNYPYKQTVKKIAKVFSGAYTNSELVVRVSRALAPFGYGGEETLVATSLCSDEVNRPLEDSFYGIYGQHFQMGGLAGFPFAGVTGFGAMASHIPDNGHCLIVYGPHVGVDLDGNVGKVNRRGKEKSGSCCGSTVAASKYIKAVYEGAAEKVPPPPSDSVDAQQTYVSNALLPYAARVLNAPDPMVELPFVAFEIIDSMMQRIVGKAGSQVGPNGQIAMLGGLQINTPVGLSDYFLPLRFDIRDSNGFIIEDFMANFARKPRKRSNA